MADIVKDLRKLAKTADGPGGHVHSSYLHDAADEIENLRIRAETAEMTIRRVLDALGSKYVTR